MDSNQQHGSMSKRNISAKNNAKVVGIHTGKQVAIVSPLQKVEIDVSAIKDLNSSSSSHNTHCENKSKKVKLKRNNIVISETACVAQKMSHMPKNLESLKSKKCAEYVSSKMKANCCESPKKHHRHVDHNSSKLTKTKYSPKNCKKCLEYEVEQNSSKLTTAKYSLSPSPKNCMKCNASKISKAKHCGSLKKHHKHLDCECSKITKAKHSKSSKDCQKCLDYAISKIKRRHSVSPRKGHRGLALDSSKVTQVKHSRSPKKIPIKEIIIIDIPEKEKAPDDFDKSAILNHDSSSHHSKSDTRRLIFKRKSEDAPAPIPLPMHKAKQSDSKINKRISPKYIKKAMTNHVDAKHLKKKLIRDHKSCQTLYSRSTKKELPVSASQAKRYSPDIVAVVEKKLPSPRKDPKSIKFSESMQIDANVVQHEEMCPEPLDVEMVDESVPPPREQVELFPTKIQTGEIKHCYIVLDTNILIADLKYVDEIKDIPFEDFGLPHIYIPWVVLQELDGLKNNVKNKQKAIDAVRYIHEKLLSKCPRFHGQSVKMATKRCNSSVQCNDDKILDCCLQLQDTMENDMIILLTNDKNLCNKALVSGVKAFTLDVLLTKLDESVAKQKKICKSVMPKFIETPQVKQELEGINSNIRMILKCVLGPCATGAMVEAFGEHGRNLLPSAPLSLDDIFNCFEKYWTPVYGVTLTAAFKEHLKKCQEILTKFDSNTCNLENALTLLESTEVVCTELAQVFPNCQRDIEVALFKTQDFKARCKSFQQHNTGIQKTMTETVPDNNTTVLKVFEHIWDLMNHLCGMILDFLGKPHELKYNKPLEWPSKRDFAELISRLYPSMHTIKKTLFRIVHGTKESQGNVVEQLYNFLIQFIPSLKIQAVQPPLEKFSIDGLKQFCYEKNNEEILQNGYKQLEDFFGKLDSCLHDPTWKH